VQVANRIITLKTEISAHHFDITPLFYVRCSCDGSSTIGVQTFGILIGASVLLVCLLYSMPVARTINNSMLPMKWCLSIHVMPTKIAKMVDITIASISIGMHSLCHFSQQYTLFTNCRKPNQFIEKSPSKV
jgi:hypothetical protein